jgi:hypothetical protein
MSPQQHTERLQTGRDATAVLQSDAPRRKIAGALEDVGKRLDASGLSSPERMRLLERQAALGDLRDELALQARRRAGDGSGGHRQG